jgi:hypothetical protein
MAIRKWRLATKIAPLKCPGPEEFVVEYPVKPGIQVCIIRDVKPGYATVLQIEDALVDVPADCPYKDAFPYPEYAGYLAIASEQYKKCIASAGKGQAKRARQSTRQSRPRIIKRGEAKANRDWKEHWLIVSRWTDWEMQGMNRSQRFEEHYWNQGKTPPRDGADRRKAIGRFRYLCRAINMPKK